MTRATAWVGILIGVALWSCVEDAENFPNQDTQCLNRLNNAGIELRTNQLEDRSWVDSQILEARRSCAANLGNGNSECQVGQHITHLQACCFALSEGLEAGIRPWGARLVWGGHDEGFVWDIFSTISFDNGELLSRVVRLDAHNGQFLYESLDSTSVD